MDCFSNNASAILATSAGVQAVATVGILVFAAVSWRVIHRQNQIIEEQERQRRVDHQNEIAKNMENRPR